MFLIKDFTLIIPCDGSPFHGVNMGFYFTPGGLLSSKAKRAKCSTHKQRVIVMLYNKVCDIVSNISELLEIQLLTDTTILQVTISKLKKLDMLPAPISYILGITFPSRFLLWVSLHSLWRMSVNFSCVPSN